MENQRETIGKPSGKTIRKTHEISGTPLENPLDKMWKVMGNQNENDWTTIGEKLQETRWTTIGNPWKTQ